MNTRNLCKQAVWSCLAVLAAPLAFRAQQAPSSPAPSQSQDSIKLEKFVVTGSLIKRVDTETALPVQTITFEEIDTRGIMSAEQLVMELNINGNGFDNLASNSDVVDTTGPRGNNGATSANLRMQGAGATLVLLNGRRVASHGLNGGSVDLNSIPFAAIQRVEVLKDGASAIYGTDAVGGVMNFILKDSYQGLTTSAAADVTELGGGNIFRGSIVGGFGDLRRDRFNVMASFAINEHKPLRGDQRDFVNTFQPERGISPDTTGTPIATIFPISTLYSAISRDNLTAAGRGAGPADPLNPNVRVTRINIVDLPGGPGYAGLDGMGPYDEVLWASPASRYGSAWDTGRAARLQQAVRNTSFVARGTYALGRHRLSAEAVIGRSISTRSFSPNQWTSSTAATTTINGVAYPHPLLNLAYPSTGADYNRVFNAMAAYFPEILPNRGLPIPFRWRSLPLGNRAYTTTSDTNRYMLGLEGPLPFDGWEYRFGGSRAESKSSSVLVSGYVYSYAFANLINTGVVNPFSYTQTPEAVAAIDRTRANGVQLFGGTFTTEQGDFTVSGPLFRLPAGQLQSAIGVDHRTEKYFFAGDRRPNAATPEAQIFNAPFDNALATAGTLKRVVKAAFAELQIPLLKGLDLNAAGRIDEYTGFGRTTNPKYTLRWAPSGKFLVRSSYSTGFRVPTFKQMFDPRIDSTYVGNDFADPARGPYNVVDATHPAAHPTIFSGGKRDLKPETAKMYSAGVVWAPSRHLSGHVDWWRVNRIGTLQNFGLTVLAQNYALFQERFLRDASGNLLAVDSRPVNAGETVTSGLDLGLKGDRDAFKGRVSGGFELSYLLEKKSRLIPTAPFGVSEIGRFTRYSDLGIRWKHTANVGYRRGNWSGTLYHVFRNHYVDAMLPGVANGSIRPPNWDPTVDSYSIFNLSVSYRGFKKITVIAGIKNLLNTDPPFSAAYDTNTGSGSSWEPRVADPRGRAYTLRVEYRFW